MKKALLTLLCYVAVVGFAMSQKNIDDTPFGFNPVKKNRKRVVSPFELKANLIVMKVIVDDSDTLNFILDTGVQSIIILDSTLMYKLDTSIGREVTITGVGQEKPYKAYVSVGHTVKIGDIIGYNQNLIILQNDLLNLSEFVGMHIHGIIGSELFRRFNVFIDYPSHEIVFSDPKKYKYKKRKGEVIELHLENTKPYISINEISVGNHTENSLKLVIDTGGTHALLLNRLAIPKKLISPTLIDANLGRGLNGKIEGKMGKVKSFTFAGQKFKNVPVTYPDSLVYGDQIYTENIFRQGSIGGEILKRFLVNFNYEQRIMVLKPIKRFIKKPFKTDMSGMDIRVVGENFDEFEVAEVIPQSPAGEAGISPGDKIIVFNKRLARSYNINEIYELLCTKEGKTIEMVVLRGNSLEEVSFVLKKLI